MHLTAAQKALSGVDDSIHQGAIWLGIQFPELELPVEMTSLPARCMQAWHHGLGERVHRHFINPFRQALAPFTAVFSQKVFHGDAVHGMTAVVAVADAIRAFDCGESHAVADRNLSLATGFRVKPPSSEKMQASSTRDLVISAGSAASRSCPYC